MKLIIMMALILPISAYANQCSIQETSTVSEVKEDINTPTPKELEDATILIKTKDGKMKEMRASDFKVVPRKQQFKVRERVIVQRVECEPQVVVKIKEVNKDTTKNLIALGVSKGYASLEQENTASSATVYYKKNIIVDALYMRRKMFGNFGLGLGIDTNTSFKGYLGYEF